MRQSQIVGSIVTLVVTAVFATSIAWAGLVGVVTAVSKAKRSITVSGASYDVDENTDVVDLSGQPITWPELRPGVNVELDFDDTGRLATIRAAVVR